MNVNLATASATITGKRHRKERVPMSIRRKVLPLFLDLGRGPASSTPSLLFFIYPALALLATILLLCSQFPASVPCPRTIFIPLYAAFLHALRLSHFLFTSVSPSAGSFFSPILRCVRILSWSRAAPSRSRRENVRGKLILLPGKKKSSSSARRIALLPRATRTSWEVEVI